MPSRKMVFVCVSVVTFVFLTIAAAVVTLTMPETYASTARIRVLPAISDNLGGEALGAYNPYLVQTEVALIESPRVLDEVVSRLDLNSRWAKKFGLQGKLKTYESRQLLRHRLDLRPVRNTSLIEIKVYSDVRTEAAEIANMIAATCRDGGWKRQPESPLTEMDAFGKALAAAETVNIASETNSRGSVSLAHSGTTDTTAPKPSPSLSSLTPSQLDFPMNPAADSHTAERETSNRSGMPRAEIVGTAMPGVRPVRPNVPLNLFLGAIMAIIVGLLFGGIAAFFVGKIEWKKAAS